MVSKKPKKIPKENGNIGQLNIRGLFWGIPVSTKRCKTRADFLAVIEECKKIYVGDQTKFNKRMSKSKDIFYCNITGKVVRVTPKRMDDLYKLYGTKEAIQQNFISYKYELLKEKYGTAWLYMHLTPKFKELRNKLRLAILAFNESDRSMQSLDNIKKKMRKHAKLAGVPEVKPIIHKRTDGHMHGVWLKGLPFVHDMFIPADETKVDWKNVQPEDIIDEVEDEDAFEELTIEEEGDEF